MTALCRMDWREVRKSSEESCVNLSSNWGSVLWGFTEREDLLPGSSSGVNYVSNNAGRMQG